MKKIILLTIGLILWVTTNSAQATDCDSTLYDNDFSCASKSVYSYCSSYEKASRTTQKYDLYEGIYCNTSRDSNDKIYKAIATQFKTEDPKWNADLVEFMLLDLNQKSLEEFLKETYGDKKATDKLPATVKREFFDKSNGDKNAIYDRVKSAYDKEKIIYQSQESLKQQFESSEIWANASLSDSPFDLVVDLNLIEKVLFGSRANWVNENDVWNWPADDDDDSSDSTNNTTSFPSQSGGQSKVSDGYVCILDNTASQNKTGAGVIPANCGNSTVDGTEECDDGNQQSGDGCSNTCKKEKGTSLICKDPNSITFKTLSPVASDSNTESSASSNNSSNNTTNTTSPINCPPGFKAVKKSTQVTQSANYPGPFVGGVLKNIPASNKKACPPGSVWSQINIAGTTEGRCFPTQLCASPEKMREFLFGTNYKNNAKTKAAAEAVEVSVCVEVKKVMNPESPYKADEGCVDCHIMAMNDIMKKMLEKNVAPLENAMQAWGISNRWGPKFSFDLNIVTKAAKNWFVDTTYEKYSDKEKSDMQFLQTRQQASNSKDPNQSVAEPSVADTLKAMGILGREETAASKQQEVLFTDLKNYRMSSDASGDQKVNDALVPMLKALESSFAAIQRQYELLAIGTNFAEKEQCEFK